MQQQIDDVARVYAESLFELASSSGGLAAAQTVGAEFAELAEIVRGDRRFREFLRTPIVDRASRERVLRSALDGSVSDLLLRFVTIVNRKGRAGELLEIERAYDALLQAKLGKVEVDVWTAGQLGPDAVRAIRERVATAIGKEVVLHTYTDPAMIGGIRLRIGDRLIDGSVAAKLRAMRSHIVERGGELRADFRSYLA
jgi:F-type H+-transporting ATPase subunit delta